MFYKHAIFYFAVAQTLCAHGTFSFSIRKTQHFKRQPKLSVVKPTGATAAPTNGHIFYLANHARPPNPATNFKLTHHHHHCILSHFSNLKVFATMPPTMPTRKSSTPKQKSRRSSVAEAAVKAVKAAKAAAQAQPPAKPTQRVTRSSIDPNPPPSKSQDATNKLREIAQGSDELEEDLEAIKETINNTNLTNNNTNEDVNMKENSALGTESNPFDALGSDDSDDDDDDEDDDEKLGSTNTSTNEPNKKPTTPSDSQPKKKQKKDKQDKKKDKNRKSNKTSSTTTTTVTATTAPAANTNNNNNSRVSFGGTQVLSEDDIIRRKEDVFTTLIVTPPKARPAKRVEAITASLQFILTISRTISKDVVICKCNDEPMDKLVMADALGDGSKTQFPSTLTELKKYFSGLHMRESPKLHIQLRVGTNSDAHELASEGNALLQGALDEDEPHSCNANWCVKHLQCAHTEDCGWIAGLFFNIDIADIQAQIQDALDKHHELKKLKTPITISIRAKNVRLEFNNGKNTKGKTSKTAKTEQETRTFHVEVKQGFKRTASRFIHAALKSMPALVQRANMKLTWVPVVDKDSSSDDVWLLAAKLLHITRAC